MEADLDVPADRSELLVLGQYHAKQLFRLLFDITTTLEKYQDEVDLEISTGYITGPLYDLLVPWKVDRHLSLLQDLCDRLEQHIRYILFFRPATAPNLLRDLLAVAFPLIYVEPLCPVVLFMMSNISNVNDRYLSAVADEPHAYEMADLTVKRQIWRSRTSRAVYYRVLKNLVKKYLNDRLASTLSTEHYFGMVPSQRMQHAAVGELCQLVGDDSRLFRRTIRFMDHMFTETLNVNIASFRTEFIMATRHTEMSNTALFNPLLILTSIMTRCIEGQDIIEHHQNALEYLMDRINPNTEYSVAIALIDPHVMNFLAKAFIQYIHVLLFRGQLAPPSRKAGLVIRLMLFGMSTFSVGPLPEYVEADPTVNFSNLLMRTISTQMATNHWLKQHLRGIRDPLVYAVEASRYNTPATVILKDCMTLHPIGATIGLHYCLHEIEQHGMLGVLRVIPLLEQCNCSIVYNAHTINKLIALLLPLDFSCEILCSYVFDRFFGRFLQYENVRHQLMGLLTVVHPQLSPARLRSLMRKIEPLGDEPTATIQQYEILRRSVRRARARAQQRGDMQ